MKYLTFIFLFSLIISAQANAARLISLPINYTQATSSAIAEQFIENNDKAGFLNYLGISENALDSDITSALAAKECDLGKGDVVCRVNFGTSQSTFFSDIEALPIASDAQAVKIGVRRFNLFLGDTLPVPISLVVADVTGSGELNEANKLRLLDPEQGINFSGNFLWKYRVGRFCQFANNSKLNGGCRVGFNLGARYLRPKDVMGENEDIFGGYVELSHGIRFPILPMEAIDDEAGHFNLITNFAYFTHNSSDRSFFSNVLDVNGQPVQFDEDYGAVTIKAQLNISKILTMSYTYYDPFESKDLKSVNTFTFTYSFLADRQ